MKIVVATKNFGKIEGARKAFSNYFVDFELEGISCQSDVSEQPINEELYLGAKNRVRNLKKYCQKNEKRADLFVSIESGMTIQLGRWMIINMAVIEDNDDFESYGTSPGFPVPDQYVEEIKGTDLGTVMDRIFLEKDLRSGSGGISLLTKDVISRIDLTESAIVMALTKYINETKWSDK